MLVTMKAVSAHIACVFSDRCSYSIESSSEPVTAGETILVTANGSVYLPPPDSAQYAPESSNGDTPCVNPPRASARLRFSPSNEIPRCSAKSTAFGIPTSDKSSTAGMLSDFARAVRSVIFPMYLSPELRGEYPSKERGLSSTVEAAVLPRSSTAGA